MFILIAKPEPAPLLEISRMVFLPVSFLFLVRFGTKVIAESKKKFLPFLKALPVILIAIWAVIVAASNQQFVMGDIWSRYLLCVPGTFLTAYGLTLLLPQFEKTKSSVVTRHLKFAAVVFFLYGILAGLIVKKVGFFPASFLNYDMVRETLGVPVQIFRAACASILAYSMLRILSVFRWETENILHESELRFHTIATTAPIILFLQDKEGVITYIEGKGLTVFGLKPAEMVGKSISDLFPDIPQIAEDTSRALAGEESVSVFTIKGTTVETCCSPIRDKGGEITGLIGVALDITQRMQVQTELDRYREKMVQTKRLAELGTMSATMTQELDEPLNVTRLLLERLLTEAHGPRDDEAITETLKKSFSEISRASAILERFCHSAESVPSTKAEPIDLYKITKRIIAVFADRAQHVNLKMVAKGLDIVPRMSISTRELEQIFFIMIQNAIDAADSRKMEKLTISYELKDKQLHLVFADTCCGIPAERLETIFQPFFMGKMADKSAGMGLAVVKRIVPGYGGSVSVESQPGKGTTFYVNLPVE
jgi:PAS domain S-box-containing protein